MPLDLTDDEKAALVDLLAGVIESDRFPLSPRVQLLRGILAKLRDNPATGATHSAPEPASEPSPSTARKRSR